MLGLGSFGHRNARQFEYRPRYFDPEKAARDERRKQLHGEVSEDDEPDKEYRPGQYVRVSMYARRGIGAANISKESSGILKRVVMVIVASFAIGMVWLLS